jgi:hypothetical protein
MGDFVDVPTGVTDWINDDKDFVLVIHGKPGTGKTQLAMAAMVAKTGNKDFIMVSERNQLQKLAESPVGTAVLFDDFNTDEFTREGLIHLVDSEQERSIRILYGTAIIPARTIKIYTLNSVATLTLGDAAIERRIKKVELPITVIPEIVTPAIINDETEVSSLPVNAGSDSSGDE